MLLLAVCGALLMSASGFLVSLAAPVRAAEGGSGLLPLLIGMVCLSMSAFLWIFVGLHLAGVH